MDHTCASLQDKQLDSLPKQPPGLLGLQAAQPSRGPFLAGVSHLPSTCTANSGFIGNPDPAEKLLSLARTLLQEIIIVSGQVEQELTLDEVHDRTLAASSAQPMLSTKSSSMPS